MSALSMFRSLFRAGSDDRSPWGDFWFSPVTGRGGSGKVSADQAMRLTAVYACVRVLSESMAVLPFVLYKLLADGRRQRVTDHWLHRLFAQRPNDWQTPFEWIEMMQGHLSLRGNAYNRIVGSARGEIDSFIPLHPDRITLELLDNGSFRYRYKERTGAEQILLRDEVWHLRGLSSDGYMGLNPIEQNAGMLSSALSTQDYANRYFTNDAKPSGGWIEFAGKFSDRDARHQFRTQWQEQQGGSNRGKIAVLENGMKFHEVAVSNKDAQFLETQQASVTSIARMFRLPPHKIGDLTRSTNNNIEQQALEFVQDALQPWAERWESSIQCHLLGEDSGLEVEFDFRNLMRGDAASRSMYYHNGILDGWLRRNEARAYEGLEPVEGLDELLVPLNMVENGADLTTANNVVPTPAQDEPPPDDSADARMTQLLQGNASRLARRIGGGGAVTPPLVAEAMAVSLDAAIAWCNKPRSESEEQLIAQLMALGAKT